MPFVNSTRSTFGTSGRFQRPANAARIESGLVTSGLVLSLDAKYPGLSPLTEWQDGSGNNRNFTFEATPTYNANNAGTYSMTSNTGFYRLGVITNSTSGTLQFWMKTNDDQALFWSGESIENNSGGYFIGAYNPSVQQYHSPMSPPDVFINTSQTTTLRSTIISNNVWRLIEFKNINFSDWPNNKFNMYGSFDFDSGEIGAVFMYNRTLSSAESLQNFNLLRGRYGI
jgi:hypothetical protein